MVRWPGDTPARGLRPRPLLAIFVAVVLVAYAWAFYEYVRTYALQPGTPPLLSRHGLAVLPRIAAAAPSKWLEPFRVEAIERLHLEVEPRHFEKLAAKRREALERQFLLTSKDDLVPARLRHDGRTVGVRVRLKGDLTDHLLGDKWSFRVEVAPGQAVLGMRRFSLQAPYTRAFQAEPLFLDFLREEGVLAPRYEIVELTVNGRRIGRMALEEHFSTELLEHQSRRDGVILRYDEQTFYAAELAFMDLVPDFDNWRNTPVDAFRRKRVEASPILSEQLEIAAGLLYGMARNELAPSDALDADLWGRFLAACEVWSMPHMTHWNNLRFYLNPITLKIEPIGFDANGHFVPHDGLRCMGGLHAMMASAIEDPELQDAFLLHLHRIRRLVATSDFASWLAEREATVRPLLAREYPWLGHTSLQAIRDRAYDLRDVSKQNLLRYLPRPPARPMPHRADADYPTVVNASLARDNAGPYLELASAISLPVTVTELWLEPPARGGEGSHSEPETQKVYHRLTPVPWPEAPTHVRVPLPEPLPDEPGWTIAGRALANERTHEFRALPGFAPRARPALPEASLDEALRQHAFLRRSDQTDASWLEAGPGRFDVTGSLVLPTGTGLRLAAGTTLRFGRGEMLLARGGLAFEGRADAPIVLEPQATSFAGIIDLAGGAAVRWSHVTVRGTAGPHRPGWAITGGVTLHRSDIELTDCVFEDVRAEDALNAIRSTLVMRDVVIRDVDSDALDADFCEGRIEGGRVETARGDGIDLSGGRFEIEGLSLHDIRDKAISVGEATHATLRGIEVSGAGVGVASKDRSHVVVTGGRMTDIGVAALMAYVKKPQYGPGTIEAGAIEMNDATRAAIAQHGSRIVLDGEEVPTEDIDVDALYGAGPMRK